MTDSQTAGGLFGLIGAKFCGPRLGRFDNGATKDLPGHDMAFVTLGTFMLWFGWFGFNSGSVYVYSTVAPAAAVQMVAMNTTLAASSAGLASLLLACMWTGEVGAETAKRANGVGSILGIIKVSSVPLPSSSPFKHRLAQQDGSVRH